MLVCVVVMGALVALFWPSLQIAVQRGEMTRTLSRARMLQISTQMLTLDNLEKVTQAITEENKHPQIDHIEWTSIMVEGRKSPLTLAAFFTALVKGRYLSEKDLRQELWAPGKGPALRPLEASTICFKFFKVDEASPGDQPFVVTANWTPAGLTDDLPYGKKGFVMFAKGGSGGIYTRPTDAASQTIFPPGPAYHYDTLK